MSCIRGQRAQAVVEMALFTGIIIVVIGALVSYLQQLNDQQYIKMESFRRALQKANTYQGEESESPGASVQMFQVENRRNFDIEGGLAKGVTQQKNADAHVFWAVSNEEAFDSAGMGGGSPEDISVAKINDNEQNTDQFPEEFFVTQRSQLEYKEDNLKLEQGQGMFNGRESMRNETVYTQIPGMEVQQYSYRDPDEQYRYFTKVPEEARTVKRGMAWLTN